jgi:hypothetical protein
MKRFMEVMGGAFGFLLLIVMAWAVLAVLAAEVHAQPKVTGYAVELNCKEN